MSKKHTKKKQFIIQPNKKQQTKKKNNRLIKNRNKNNNRDRKITRKNDKHYGKINGRVCMMGGSEEGEKTKKKSILQKVGSFAHSKLFRKNKKNEEIKNNEKKLPKNITIVKQVIPNDNNDKQTNKKNINRNDTTNNFDNAVNDYIGKEVKNRFNKMVSHDDDDELVINKNNSNSLNTKNKNNLNDIINEEEVEYDAEYCNLDDNVSTSHKEKILKKARDDFRTCVLNKNMSREKCEKLLEDQIDEYESTTEKMEKKKNMIKFPKLESPNFNTALDNYFTGKTGQCDFTIPLAETATVDECGGKVVSASTSATTSTSTSQQGGERIIRMKGGGKIKPTKYQVLASKLVHPHTDLRGIVAFHGLGSGKTILSVLTIANFMRYEPDRVICFIAPPGLVSNFSNDLNKFDNFVLFGHEIANSFNTYALKMREELMNSKLSELEIKTIIKDKLDRKKKREIDRRIVVMSYESWGNRLRGRTAWDTSVNTTDVVEAKKNKNGFGGIVSGSTTGKKRFMDSAERPLFDNTLVVMDEAQELISSKDNKVIPHMNWIQQAVRNANDIRILFMTATPMKAHPYELGVLLNLLKPMTSNTRFNEFYEKDLKSGCMIVDTKKTIVDFNATYVNKTDDIEEVKNTDLFRSKLKGLISYYSTERNIAQFAIKNERRPVIVDMENAHYKAWRLSRTKEMEECEKKGNKISCNNASIKKCKSSRQVSLNSNSRREKIKSSIKKGKLVNDASKIFYACDNIEQLEQKGKQFVYSEFNVNGLYAIKMELRRRGWIEYGFGKGDGEDNWVSIDSLFTPESYRTKLKALSDEEWVEKADMSDEEKIKSGNTGGGSWINKEQPLKKHKAFITMGDNTDSKYKEGMVKGLYNRMKNMNGDFINCMIVNSKYSEGISLKHVQQVHILEPPTSISLRDQIIGRAIRRCSHKGMAFPYKWKVGIYEYYSTHNELGYYEPARIRTFKPNKIDNDEEPAREQQPAQGGAPRVKKEVKQWCSGFETQNDCNLKEYCQWSEVKEGVNANKCMELSTDFVISKMTDRANNLKQQFLKLLKESAVDCVAFKNANEPDLQCYRPYRNEQDAEKDMKNSYDVQVKKCGEMSNEECNTSSSCILSDNKCNVIKLQSSECKKYRDDKNCLKNNWCNWDENTDKCFTYYTEELKKYANAISFDNIENNNNNKNNNFVMEIKDITNNVINSQLKFYFEQLEKSDSIIEIEETLESIFDLLKIYIELRKEYKTKLVKIMNEIKKNKVELWTNKMGFIYEHILKMIINQETNKNGIGESFLSMFKNKKDDNTNDNNIDKQLKEYYDKKNTRDNEKYKKVWLSGNLYNQTQTVNLLDVKKNDNELEYILKLKIGRDDTRKIKGIDYLLVSKNIKGMSINLDLQNLEKIKKITKEFKYYDVYIKLEFELLFGKFDKVNIVYNIDKDLHENPIKTGYESVNEKIEYK
jgi:hypothetical protein